MSLSKASLIARWPENKREEFLNKLTPEQKHALKYSWEFMARPEQLAPEGDWTTLLLLAGRGFGKSRSLTEWVRQRVNKGARYIGIVGRTIADTRNVLIEGPSGLLNIFPPDQRPKYEPSKRRLTFHTGAIATTYSADKPDQLRGPEHDTIIADEIATWNWAAWENLQLGLRSKSVLQPQVAAATTPKSRPRLRKLAAEKSTVVVRGSTYDNSDNLPTTFINAINSMYEGTSIGQQEIYAALLDDTPGALWQRKMIDDHRVTVLPPLTSIVVGVDPSVSEEGSGAETGIVVVGKDAQGHGYVIADYTLRGSPDKWAKHAVHVFHVHGASKIIAEANNGGALVKSVLHTVDPNATVKLVHATKGKATRAEPVVARYEQGKVHHLNHMDELEDQMCTWVPNSGEDSPDRVDACVWALSELILGAEPCILY